jgi:hypothetical protein
MKHYFDKNGDNQGKSRSRGSSDEAFSKVGGLLKKLP